MTYSIRAAAACSCAALKKKDQKAKPRRKSSRLTDKRCALPFFVLRDKHHLLLAELSSAGTGATALSSRYRPWTVSNRSRVSYDASDANTNMTTFSRPASSIKPRRSWGPLTILTAGFASGTNPNPTRHPGAGVLGGVSGLRMLHGLNRTSAKDASSGGNQPFT